MNDRLTTRYSGKILLELVFLLALSLSACSALTNSAQGKVISEFMTAMLNKDVAAAAALFPTGSEAEMTPQLEGLLADQYYLFEGYQSITVTSLNSSVAENQTTAELEGAVSYAGNMSGNFQASLVKEGETWKLTNITVNVPEEKIQ